MNNNQKLEDIPQTNQMFGIDNQLNNFNNFLMQQQQLQPNVGFTAPGQFVQQQFCPEPTDITHTGIYTEQLSCYKIQKSYTEQLNLDTFKKNPCQIDYKHNHKQCAFWHSNTDKRRPTKDFQYSDEKCEVVESKEICIKGDKCPKSHNRVEQLYHPKNYKAKFCMQYSDKSNKVLHCDYDKYCSFAHSDQDISISLIHNYVYDEDFYMFHYKTVQCPFNLKKHDKGQCVYWHNYQDYRRSPTQFQYGKDPCTNWKDSDIIIDYDKGCINGKQCNQCHGWKEHEYHPKNYKTLQCTNYKKCQKEKFCPYYHDQSEKRFVNYLVQQNIFKFVPVNRIISNTFKTRTEKICSDKQDTEINDAFNSSYNNDKNQFSNQLLSSTNVDSYTKHSEKLDKNYNSCKPQQQKQCQSTFGNKSQKYKKKKNTNPNEFNGSSSVGSKSKGRQINKTNPNKQNNDVEIHKIAMNVLDEEDHCIEQ